MLALANQIFVAPNPEFIEGRLSESPDSTGKAEHE